MWFLTPLIGMVVVNACWTYTICQLSKRRRMRALISDGMLVTAQGLITISYVQHGTWVILPAVAGSTIGMLLAFWVDSRNK